MSQASLSLQEAIRAAIVTAGTEAGADVFDTVPERDPYPRVTIGEGNSAGLYADCLTATETFLDVHVWSRRTGFPEAKRIAGQVRAVLHDANLVLVGQRLDLLEFVREEHLRDPDGLTSHIAMSFRALTTPAD